MGAYRSAPIKQKEQEEGGNKKLSYACTSMQGWRIRQEDAHNCIVDFDENSSLFAVYDGHGGSEVAIYISENFPAFLKKNGLLTSNDIAAAFRTCFIDFDHSLCSEKIVQAMNVIKSKVNPPKAIVDEAEEREALMEEAVALSKEASVSLETIFKQYSEISRQLKDASYNDGKIEKRALGEPSSYLVKRRKMHRENATIVEEEERNESVSITSTIVNAKSLNKTNGLSDNLSEKTVVKNDKNTKNLNGGTGNTGLKNLDFDKCSKTVVNSVSEKVKENGNEHFSDIDVNPDHPHSTKSEFGETEISTDDEDDEDFDVEECEDGEQIVDEETEDNEIDEENDPDFETDFLVGRDKPGFDSGATACVALIHMNRLIVANVGDSRAVLCRDGKAIDLSTDHKPEDIIEKTRIEKAGGNVGEDGRVNGGLNLSRALGDHYYKQKPDLPLDQQMITACPDVLINELTDMDTLLIIACDGIWNSLTSQEVIDFVNNRIDTMSLKKIGSEICEFCCAPDTSGDGTGCDNMTIIIIDLKHGILKSNITD